MKKLAYCLLVGSLLAMNVPAFAEDRAVNIAFGSIGGPLDDAALQTVRQVIGYAVARGTVDTKGVYPHVQKQASTQSSKNLLLLSNNCILFISSQRRSSLCNRLNTA